MQNRSCAKPSHLRCKRNGYNWINTHANSHIHSHTHIQATLDGVSVKVAEEYPRVHHASSQQTGDTQEPLGLCCWFCEDFGVMSPGCLNMLILFIDADGDVSCSISSLRWRCWVQSPSGGLEGDVKCWTVVYKQHSHVFSWPRWKSAVWRVNLLALHATCRGSRGVWGWWMLWLTAQEREQHTIPSIPICRRLPTPSTCE